MSLIYRKEESLEDAAVFDELLNNPEGKKWWQQIVYFAVLVGILIFAASKNWIVTGILLAVLGLLLWQWFTKGEI